MTALMIAVQTGQPEAVRLLLSKGAKPDTRALNGETALSLSRKANHLEITADLERAGAAE